MTLIDAQELFQYWLDFPPENEMLALFARVYTTWEPKGRPMTDEDRAQSHQESLEQRWKAGAMNAKQLFESMGGKSAVSIDMSGNLKPAEGIKSFPGN